MAAGVDVEQLVLDPGLGFAKDAGHNWALLGRLARARTRSGRPLLVGASRKRFLGSLLAGADGAPRPVEEREAATLATTVLAAAGRRVVRAGARGAAERRRRARRGGQPAAAVQRPPGAVSS